MITRVLVANRGEIARRVFRSCRDLGLSTVAVYSDSDRGSPHVAEADLAVRLPGEAAADTYLRADLVVDAALRSGADAVHPGYGFLSENAAFARAVQQAGLTWVGPPPAAIEAMGSKIESKRLMAAAGVPVLPELSPDALTEADLPVLIKASAGGGGRGMRVVRAMAELPAGLAAARSEAAAAFGNPTVFCEPYLETGRHLEVQILADTAGTVWTIGERECSIQRRHQKIIEEAPSPLAQRITGMRERLLDAARAAACAVGYINAGTAEFLADDSGQFYFLEMNTRLQVEHPVTECTTGSRFSCRWQPASGCLPRRRMSLAMRSKFACTPRIRRSDGNRKAARCTGSRCPECSQNSRRCQDLGRSSSGRPNTGQHSPCCGWTLGLSMAAMSAPATTPCSPR
jgi:propionyl-CoA carboxylase alpha chain